MAPAGGEAAAAGEGARLAAGKLEAGIAPAATSACAPFVAGAELAAGVGDGVENTGVEAGVEVVAGVDKVPDAGGVAVGSATARPGLGVAVVPGVNEPSARAVGILSLSVLMGMLWVTRLWRRADPP
jgi:hypothetical protein